MGVIYVKMSETLYEQATQFAKAKGYKNIHELLRTVLRKKCEEKNVRHS